MTIDGKDHFVRGRIFLDTWKWLFLKWTDDDVWRVRGNGNTPMEAYESWRRASQWWKI